MAMLYLLSLAVLISFCVLVILLLWAVRFMHHRQARRLSRAQRWRSFAQSRTGFDQPGRNYNNRNTKSKQLVAPMPNLAIKINPIAEAPKTGGGAIDFKSAVWVATDKSSLLVNANMPPILQHVIDFRLPTLNPVPLSPIPEDFVVRDSYEKKRYGNNNNNHHHKKKNHATKQPWASFVQHYGSCAPTAVAA